MIENGDVVNDNPLLDFSGWDLRKYLGLITKSNPVAFEWLRSTISYHESDLWSAVRHAAHPFFSPKAAMHHYLSMARHNYREHMRDGMAASVRLKKYLYITRPLLCCRWIERGPTAGPPPMPFAEVLDADSLEPEVTRALADLVVRKRRGEELDEGSAIPCINRFIDTELWRLRTVADGMPVGTGKVGDLDRVLYQLASS